MGRSAYLLNIAWNNNAFHASKNIPAVTPRFAAEEFLFSQGIILGIVRDTIGPFKMFEKLKAPANQIEAAAKAEYVILCQYYMNLHQDQRKGFWRTLILDREHGDITKPTSPAPGDFVFMFDVYMDIVLVRAEFEPELPEWDRKVRFIAPLSNSIDCTWAQCCFFTTDTGHVGMGPFITQSGDSVTILIGASFCSMLRKDSESELYKLLGDAYDHGVMNGELIETDNDGNVLNAQEIRLC
jgi:hypothetical protein